MNKIFGSIIIAVATVACASSFASSNNDIIAEAVGALRGISNYKVNSEAITVERFHQEAGPINKEPNRYADEFSAFEKEALAGGTIVRWSASPRMADEGYVVIRDGKVMRVLITRIQ